MGRKQKSKRRNKSKLVGTPKSPDDSVRSEDSSAIHQPNEDDLSKSTASASPKAGVQDGDFVHSQSSISGDVQLSRSEEICNMLIKDWNHYGRRIQYLMTVFKNFFHISSGVLADRGNTAFQTYKDSIRYFTEQFEILRKECRDVNTTPESDNRGRSEPNTDLFLNGLPLIDDIYCYKELLDELITPYSFYEDLFSGAEPKWKAEELKLRKSSSEGDSSRINNFDTILSPNYGTNQAQLIEQYPEMRVLRAFRWMHDLHSFIKKTIHISSLKSGLILRFISESPPEEYLCELLNFVNKIAALLNVLEKLRDAHQKICNSVDVPKTENPLKDHNIDIQILVLNEKSRLMVLYWALLKYYDDEILLLLNKAIKFL